MRMLKRGGWWIKTAKKCMHIKKITFLWPFIWASANFETYFTVHAAILCESVEEKSLKQSAYFKAKNKIM